MESISRFFGILFIITSAVIVLTICSGTAHSNQQEKINIIILLLDCVRADHLGCYGYSRNTSPNIDALRNHGTKFRSAIAQAPWTLPSVTSLLTGLYPHHHGVGLTAKAGRNLSSNDKSVKMLSSTIPTLPEQLKQAGYATFGFSTNGYINNKSFGTRGFDDFLFQVKAAAENVVDYGIKMISAIENNKRPFFLYLHFMDAHEPLKPPEKFYNFFPTSDGKPNTKTHERWQFSKFPQQKGIAFENYKEHKLSLYDGSIRYIDSQIGRLVRFINKSDLITNTMILVVADHGEEFWDHAAFEYVHYTDPRGVNGVGHGHALFQELTRVPLIITNLFPNEFNVSEINDVVQLIDVLPTLLERINSKVNVSVDGRSFLNRNNSDWETAISESPAYGNSKICLIENNYKYIYSYNEKDSLFNIKNDQFEKKDLLKTQKDIATAMFKQIKTIEETIPVATESLPLSDKDIEILRSLGYVE